MAHDPEHGPTSRRVAFTRQPIVAMPKSGRMRWLRSMYAGAALLLPIPFVVWAGIRAVRFGLGVAEFVPFAVMYLVTQLGVTLGYHRYASHRSFRATPTLEAILLVAGSMAGQGPLIPWVANHRRHHRFADQPLDPHSPTVMPSGARAGKAGGLFHAHVGWTFTHDLSNTPYFCRDLLASSRARFMSRCYLLWLLLSLMVPAFMGWLLTGNAQGALSGLLWGGFVRFVLAYHATMTVNSLAHVAGSRPFETRDTSGNVPWLVIPTVGEGWHNNHHAFPSSAYMGLQRGELDPGGFVLSGLAALGWIRDAKRPSRTQIEERRRRKSTDEHKQARTAGWLAPREQEACPQVATTHSDPPLHEKP